MLEHIQSIHSSMTKLYNKLTYKLWAQSPLILGWMFMDGWRLGSIGIFSFLGQKAHKIVRTLMTFTQIHVSSAWIRAPHDIGPPN